MAASMVHPLEVVHHRASGELGLRWSDGLAASLPSQALREACRCADCEQLRRAGQGPRAAHGARLVALQPVGEYALQLCFDDGHYRGIYPWAYLHELCAARDPRSTP